MAGGAKEKRVARGSKKEEKKKGTTRDAVADLSDDVLVDIISRVPIKSVCLCKSVCRRWRDLISHPEHRKKLPQTLAGFFYQSYDISRFPKSARHFTNVSGVGNPLGDPLVDPSLSFLTEYKNIDIADTCNGLLLCHCWKPTDPVTMNYVVCNPATEKWVVVPNSGWSSKATYNKVRIARLGFDPAVSSHFHVFEFIPDDVWYMEDDKERNVDGRIEVVAIYSSKTGVWSFNKDHFYYYSVWVLEDYNSENWSLKHNVSPQHLFGAHYYSKFGDDFSVVSIHPEHDTIFVVCGTDKTLKSCEMDRMRLCYISQLGCHCSSRYIPYVPLFSDSLADEH